MTEAWPVPADFAAPPDDAQRARWSEADRAARPARLARLRARWAEAGVDGYFGVRSEHTRYLTGLAFEDGEDRVAGASGKFLVGADEVVLLADSRYTIQARREAPDTRIAEVYGNLGARWPELVASIGARRVAVEAGFVPQATWARLAAAAPDVELVPVEGWLEADRATKEPAELERVAAACAVADRALAGLLPEIRPGVTEHDLALRLEWSMRTGGADALAFGVACLAGPEAALPHGSPGERPVLDRAVLLFDFGAQVAGYRSDMTRTLFVGEPTARDLEVYELVARAQAAAIEAHRGRRGRRHEPERAGGRRDRPHGDRRCRSRRALRPWHGTRHRPRDPRGAEPRPERSRDPAPRAPRSSRWSPGSTWTARPGSASRTSSPSMSRPALPSA